jgi:hypothetical protein
MPRRLNSVNQGGHYVEAIDVVESELEAVVSMLGITDAQESETARHQVHALLEDLKTDRARTVMVKTVPEDLQDLEQLAKATDPGWVTERLHLALDALESLQKSNPVLHRRLKWVAPQHRLRDQMAALKDSEEAIFTICREISDRIPVLKDIIASEDGRGRPTDEAALEFASSLYDIWVEFTARGTSRQNAPGRQKDPFGDFVDAAGKLIEPGFKGHHLARQIHEAHRQPPSGEK